MSFFGGLKKPKTSSSRERISQSSGDGFKNASEHSHKTGSNDTGASLFSGMTLTTSPVTTASNDLSLMGDTNVITGKQQRESAETVSAVTQDVSTVLAIPECEVLPEPIQPIPVNSPQHVGQSVTKKKKTRHTVRPGYARQSDSKAGEKSHEVAVEKSCDTAVEQERVTVKQDDEDPENSRQPEGSTPIPLTPMYSIGTPSSSDENLFQEVETHLDTGNPVPTSGEGTCTLKGSMASDIQGQGHDGKNADVSMNVPRSENAEMDAETTNLLGKGFEDSILQAPERIDYSLEGDKLSVLFQTSVALDDCSTLEKEEVDQNEKHDELQQSTGYLVSATEMESPDLGVTEKVVYLEDKPAENSISVSSTDKLSIVLQHMESQLSTLSEDKQSLRSLEEELFEMYRETESVVHEKEQQVKDLQQQESQALASDNYDLAEEISNRVEQLKADLESSRYRLPAQDEKVEKALKLRAEVAEKEAGIYRQCQVTLEEVREEQQECLTNHKEMSIIWSAREKQRLNADRQRLERAKDHLRLDKEHMETENMELSKEILQQTEVFQSRKEELILERGTLQAEISALEAKLAKLKENESKFTDAIKQEENKIESVKTEFTPQQNALDKQQQEIEAREKSLQEEFEFLLSTQKQFDDKTREHCTKEEALNKVLSSASDELGKSKQVIKGLEEQQQFVQEFLNMEHFAFDADSKLARLHTKQKEVSQQIKALSNTIQLGQRGVVTLRKSLNEIEAQISDLDAAKEIAKQERNFKEAKRLKEEREALTQEGVESQKKLESLLKELAEDKKLLEKAEQEIDDLDTEISEKDRQAAMVTVEKASLVIQILQEQVNRIGGDSLVKALLETESKTCKNLISDLCNKHDIPMPDLNHTQVCVERVVQDISENTEEVSEPQESLECDKKTEKETKRLEELQDKLSELEGRLEAVVEIEDFDEADRIQQEITKLKDKLEQRHV